MAGQGRSGVGASGSAGGLPVVEILERGSEAGDLLVKRVELFLSVGRCWGFCGVHGAGVLWVTGSGPLIRRKGVVAGGVLRVR